MDRNIVKLKDITVNITDGTHSTVKDVIEGSYYLLSCKNIKNGKVKVGASERRIDEETLLKLKKRTQTNIDDILLTTVGTIGEMAMVEVENPPYDFQRSVGIIKSDTTKVIPKYLYYALMNEKRQILSLAKGAVQQCLFLGDIKEIEIVLPRLEIQKKVISILNDLDKKIDVNNQINRNLTDQVSAIYKSWFVDFELSDGSCPDTWKIATLGDLAIISSGKRPPVKQTDKTDDVATPLVGAASVMGYTNEVLYDSKILITGRVGTHGVIQRFNEKCWPSDNTLVITTLRYEFVYQILQGIDYASMNRGSTQPLITQSDLKKTEIIIPTADVLEKFEVLAGGLMEQYEKNCIENIMLTELRDTLLPKLMSGELDVSQQIDL